WQSNNFVNLPPRTNYTLRATGSSSMGHCDISTSVPIKVAAGGKADCCVTAMAKRIRRSRKQERDRVNLDLIVTELSCDCVGEHLPIRITMEGRVLSHLVVGGPAVKGAARPEVRLGRLAPAEISLQDSQWRARFENVPPGQYELNGGFKSADPETLPLCI